MYLLMGKHGGIVISGTSFVSMFHVKLRGHGVLLFHVEHTPPPNRATPTEMLV